MSKPNHKHTGEKLIEELEALQKAGDEIRARIKATMAELEVNAAKIRKVTERGAAGNRKRPS